MQQEKIHKMREIENHIVYLILHISCEAVICNLREMVRQKCWNLHKTSSENWAKLFLRNKQIEEQSVSTIYASEIGDNKQMYITNRNHSFLNIGHTNEIDTEDIRYH